MNLYLCILSSFSVRDYLKTCSKNRASITVRAHLPPQIFVYYALFAFFLNRFHQTFIEYFKTFKVRFRCESYVAFRISSVLIITNNTFGGFITNSVIHQLLEVLLEFIFDNYSSVGV